MDCAELSDSYKIENAHSFEKRSQVYIYWPPEIYKVEIGKIWSFLFFWEESLWILAICTLTAIGENGGLIVPA